MLILPCPKMDNVQIYFRHFVVFCSASVSRGELAARSADRQTIASDEVRLSRAQVEEISRETGHLGERVGSGRRKPRRDEGPSPRGCALGTDRLGGAFLSVRKDTIGTQ